MGFPPASTCCASSLEPTIAQIASLAYMMARPWHQEMPSKSVSRGCAEPKFPSCQLCKARWPLCKQLPRPLSDFEFVLQVRKSSCAGAAHSSNCRAHAHCMRHSQYHRFGHPFQIPECYLVLLQFMCGIGRWYVACTWHIQA